MTATDLRQLYQRQFDEAEAFLIRGVTNLNVLREAVCGDNHGLPEGEPLPQIAWTPAMYERRAWLMDRWAEVNRAIRRAGDDLPSVAELNRIVWGKDAD